MAPNPSPIRRGPIALLALGAVSAIALAGCGGGAKTPTATTATSAATTTGLHIVSPPSNLPLAPLSSVGKLLAAPSPGSEGPEGVPVPKGSIFDHGLLRKVALNKSVDGVTCQRVEKLDYHIHAHLTIFVDGKAMRIPYGIGIGPPLEGLNTSFGPFVTVGTCFMWLHTHAFDGIIHIESPTARLYTLAQFFAVWGQPLTTTRVGPYQGKVTTFYNGKVWTGNPGAIPLTSEVQIQLDVGTPLIAPEHITFPSGLAPSTSGSLSPPPTTTGTTTSK